MFAELSLSARIPGSRTGTYESRANHNIKCSHTAVSSKPTATLHDWISTAQTAVAMTSENPEYERLAVAVTVSHLHKSTGTFLDTNRVLRAVGATTQAYDALVDYNRDYQLGYAKLKAMMTTTLVKIDGVIERPQSNLIRASLFLNGHNTEEVLVMYEMLSNEHLTMQAPIV